MNNYKNIVSIVSILFLSVFVLNACKKSSDDTPAAATSPRVGTIWTYRYYVYNQDGSLHTSQVITLKAQSQETFGGESWLKIVDDDADTVVYYLSQKTGGLYQYTNNSSNLFCKSPVALNDVYTTFNEGSSEDFTVKGVGDILSTGLGDIPVNYYEGVKGGQLIDLVWYNQSAWIVRKTQYRNHSLITPFFYKYYTFFLDSVVY